MKQLKLLLKSVDGKLSPAEKFHSKTKVVALDTKIPLSKIPKSWKTIHFKTYSRFKAYKIAIPYKESNLAEIIKKRKTSRFFTGEAITYSELSYILHYAAGIKEGIENMDDSRRMYPSAGARYPLEVYSIILNIKNLTSGLYHYNVKEECLEMLVEEDIKERVINIFGGEKWLRNAAAIFIITGILRRNQIKYKERGYKFMLIETGHLAQNICLLATDLGLGVCTLGGYIDSMVEELLDIRFPKEFPLYVVAVGIET